MFGEHVYNTKQDPVQRTLFIQWTSLNATNWRRFARHQRPLDGVLQLFASELEKFGDAFTTDR